MTDTLAQFAGHGARKTEKHEAFPGCTVLLRELTLAQRGEYVTAVRKDGGRGGLEILIKQCVLDPDTMDPVFPADYDLDAISAGILEDVATRVLMLSGMLVDKKGEAGNG